MRFPFNDHDGDITPKYPNRSVGLYESVQNKRSTGPEAATEPGAPQDDVQPPAAASVERDADPLFPAPDDVTRPFQLLARDHQREAIRNKQRGHDVEGGSGLREVPDCAGNFAAGERDRAGLQDAAPRADPLLVHPRIIGRVDSPGERDACPGPGRAIPSSAIPVRNFRTAKLDDTAWNCWRRKTSNLCSRSSPQTTSREQKPPKVGGLGVTPIPRWGRLCFGASKTPPGIY